MRQFQVLTSIPKLLLFKKQTAARTAFECAVVWGYPFWGSSGGTSSHPILFFVSRSVCISVGQSITFFPPENSPDTTGLLYLVVSCYYGVQVLPEVMALIPSFTPQGLSLVIWSYAKLRVAPRAYPRLVWAAYPAVCAKLGRFTPHGLVLLAYALALARFRHEPLLDVVTGQCTARMSTFSARVRSLAHPLMLHNQTTKNRVNPKVRYLLLDACTINSFAAEIAYSVATTCVQSTDLVRSTPHPTLLTAQWTNVHA